MKKTSGVRRLLSIVLSTVLLFSALAIIEVSASSDVWGFETDTLGENLSLSTTYTAVPTDTVSHSGSRSLLLNGSKKAAAQRPQVTLKKGTGETVSVVEGGVYNVTFYVLLPEDAPDNRFFYWLTATDSTVAYTTTDEKNADLFYEPAAAIRATKGSWYEVKINNVTAAHSGNLRLGISINSNTAHVLYVDDILVESASTPTPPPAPVAGPWGFESEAKGTVLDLNSNVCTIVVSDEIPAFAGSHTAKVTSAVKSGNGRPQLTVLDAGGNKIRVFKGRSYEFTFQVFIPTGSNEYGFSYWLAAAPDEAPFTSAYSKDAYVLAEVSSGSQPTQGQWTEITMTVSNCPYSGLLRLGLTGDINEEHSFYIDNLSVAETVLDYDMDSQSFEIYNEGDKLSLGTGAAAVTATTEDAHAGTFAAKVVATGNGIDGTPQMLVTDAAGAPIVVEKHGKYNISFYVCLPLDTADTAVCYWLTAGDDTPFSSAHPRTGVVVDTQTVTITDKGSWQYVLVAIDDCAAAGNLRLGITGAADAPLTFYLDDVLVKTRTAGATDAEAMHFEGYPIGENLSLMNNATETMTVTNQQSYTGLQSILVKSTSRAGDLRPQMMVKDGDGKQVKLEKGKDYYLTFMVFIPEGQDYFDLSYWAASVPDDKMDVPFVRDTDFVKNDFVVAEVSQRLAPTLGEWVEISLPITNCKLSGNLRFGITHHTQGVKSQMYVDDIKVVPPQYILVKFDTHGSADVYEDVIVLSNSMVPYSGIDPYREGYEFMGWYTDESYEREHFFDITSTPVAGVTGDVITLHARWREWSKVTIDLGGHEDEEKEEYKTIYYTDKVWVGDQNVPDPLDIGERPAHKEAAPIEEVPASPAPLAEEGLPPWLMVVIIGGAVAIIGGGAVVATVLLKKSKKA